MDSSPVRIGLTEDSLLLEAAPLGKGPAGVVVVCGTEGQSPDMGIRIEKERRKTCQGLRHVALATIVVPKQAVTEFEFRGGCPPKPDGSDHPTLQGRDEHRPDIFRPESRVPELRDTCFDRSQFAVVFRVSLSEVVVAVNVPADLVRIAEQPEHDATTPNQRAPSIDALPMDTV